MKKLFPLLAVMLLVCCKETSKSSDTAVTTDYTAQWDTLFNGRSLEGWTPKIKGQQAGSDTLNTFRAENGMIRVVYDRYATFDNRFGHLFYDHPYSAYFLSLEYRFHGRQMPDAEAWAYKNSGVMFHAQPAGSMRIDQNFPVSLEGQFLGGNGKEPRPTMNLCTPGTHVVLADTLFTPHCISSTSPTFNDEQWTEAGLLVLADSLVVHYVNGEEVLRYSKPQLGGDMAEDAAEAYRAAGTPLTSGYIALQSESHPVDFRNIRILNLAPVLHDKAMLKQLTEEVTKGDSP